ncbi:MAG: nucleotidyltransferase family protein [Candidatus Omnitrophica bacterium]|nr:nucleotidyltransferase family protein [Candidatus Omnitrophota bacterium]
MKTKDEVIAVLKTVKDQLKAKYKVKALWAFGSLVRGENTALSDIDILVDFDEGADLFSLISLEILLEEKLQQKVDVVPLRALRKEIKENVFREMITV